MVKTVKVRLTISRLTQMGVSLPFSRDQESINLIKSWETNHPSWITSLHNKLDPSSVWKGNAFWDSRGLF